WGGDPPGTPRSADGAWAASRQAPWRVLAWGGDPAGTPRWPGSPRDCVARAAAVLAGAGDPPAPAGGAGVSARQPARLHADRTRAGRGARRSVIEVPLPGPWPGRAWSGS